MLPKLVVPFGYRVLGNIEKWFCCRWPAVKIGAIDLFANYAVLSEWENGLQQIEVIDLMTSKHHRIEFPEPVHSASLSNNREFDTNVLRYNYQSLATPSSVFDYDLINRKTTLLKQTEVPGGFDKSNYKSERVFATGRTRSLDLSQASPALRSP